MTKKNRWVLLKHIECLNDLKDFHFDLLLEDGYSCRSWRLTEMPELDGPKLQIFSIKPHNLSWLASSGRHVSGNRGYAFPVKKGFFFGELSKIGSRSFQINCVGDLTGILEISMNYCCLRSIPTFVREH